MTQSRHVALIVEDDQELARDLEDVVASLGHDHIHASTKEEADRIVASGTFCYALVDLQIKVNADSLRARIEAGQSLLEAIRTRYPRQEGRHHALPVIMMSAHAKDENCIVDAVKSGADAYLVKPLGDRVVPKIREMLLASGREDHAACAARTEVARSRAPMAEAVAPLAGPVTLDVTAKVVSGRSGIRLDGVDVYLPDSLFALLLKFVAARLKDNAWIHTLDLGRGAAPLGHKGTSKLNLEMKPYLPSGMPLLENNKGGRYRLHERVRLGHIDVGAIGRVNSSAAADLEALIGRASPSSTRRTTARRA
jgi:CheY-like chemotaxis protein